GPDGVTGTAIWLSVLLERHAPMAAALSPGLDPAAVQGDLARRLQTGDGGRPLQGGEVERLAVDRAFARGRTEANERDLAAVILATAGYAVSSPAETQSPVNGVCSPAAPSAEPNRHPPGATALRPTPTLDQFGRNLTRQAQEGKLSAFVGRETEIELVIETLCRR
ncbi:MAG: hypothetical protein M3Y56_08090, partial [Armatimonadota bacterium]|nr:hypothetical protein [Armatimonadota bacterium]